MSKKLFGIVFIIAILVVLAYLKIGYPGSQLQIKQALGEVVTEPVTQYFNSTDNKCGIWYKSQNPNAKLKEGRENSETEACFKEAFDKCLHKSILIVKDNYSTNDNNVIYSLIRIIKPNDQNECIIQNNYLEYSLSKPLDSQIPLNFVNTCTSLNETLDKSCEPAYMNDVRAQIKNEANNSALQVEIN